jgi:hypothetical protein
MKQKRYLVFERPKGGKCWRLAYTSDGETALEYEHRKFADMTARNVRERTGWVETEPHRRPMQAHVAKVELPE